MRLTNLNASSIFTGTRSTSSDRNNTAFNKDTWPGVGAFLEHYLGLYLSRVVYIF